MSCH